MFPWLHVFSRYNLVNGAVSKWHAEQATGERPQVLRTWTELFRPEGVRNIMDSPGKVVPDRKLCDHKSTKSCDEVTFQDNCEFWAWIFVWTRFSYMGVSHTWT